MFIVLTYRDGFHKDTNYVGPILVDAQEQFLQACEKELHWKERDNLVRKEALDAGYVKFGRGSITLIDTSNTVTDADLVRQINCQPIQGVRGILDNVSVDQGWDEAEKIIHLIGYMEEVANVARNQRTIFLRNFQTYLLQAAAEENAGAAEFCRIEDGDKCPSCKPGTVKRVGDEFRCRECGSIFSA